MKKRRVKVVRVAETEFALSDGDIFQLPERLSPAPTPAEFQKTYGYWSSVFATRLRKRLHDLME